MHKIYILTLLVVTTVFCSQSLYAHGGGGSDTTYNFDASDRAAEREVEKKVAEKKKEQDDWAEFMKAANKPKKDNESKKGQDHGHHNGATDK